MTAIALELPGEIACTVRRFEGSERLGESSTFEIEIVGRADHPIKPGDVLRKPAILAIDSETGSRRIAGVVTRFIVVATDHAVTGGDSRDRRYRVTLRSRFALAELRRMARTFQKMTAPEIVAQVMTGAGYESVQQTIKGKHDKLRWVVQYQESDAQFVRRICEDAGLYFRFEPTEQGEAFALEDTSHDAPKAYDAPITLVARASSRESFPLVTNPRKLRRRAPGKVTLRDYDVDHPNAPLEGKAKGGNDFEQELEVYEAPGGFKQAGRADDRASVRLQSLRASASILVVRTSALAIAPGTRFKVVAAPDYAGHVDASGEHVAVAITTRWAGEGHAVAADVECLPRDVPYRLPHVTTKPKIPGVQSAWIAGEKGQEIHPDELGRVHVRFHWDVHGATDHNASLPIRAMQPHAPGAMIVPRIGWEIFAMFEDGDPDRPFVVGRSYNAKQPPPQSLPANKTITSIASDSSPGAPARTVIQMDDAAGRQHLVINAPFAKHKKVVGKNNKQVVKNENHQVGAAYSAKVGGPEDISVHKAWLAAYGSRFIGVAAAQYQSAGGYFTTVVGPERVAIGAALIEQVGNPVKGAANLAFNTALARVGATGVAGAVVAAAVGVGRAGVEGGQAGAGRGLFGVAMSFVPGGEAIAAAVTGSSHPMPWDHGRPPDGNAAAGGGGSGAGGGDAGPSGPGPGHRTSLINGSYSEIVGGMYGIATPGSISWVTLGPSNVLVNNHHLSEASTGGLVVGGGMNESLAELHIETGGVIARKVLGLYKSTVNGPLEVSAAGEYRLHAKTTLSIKVDGNLTISRDTVTFKCGSSEISASSGGVKMKSPSIKITGSSKQSGSLTHK